MIRKILLGLLPDGILCSIFVPHVKEKIRKRKKLPAFKVPAVFCVVPIEEGQNKCLQKAKAVWYNICTKYKSSQ